MPGVLVGHAENTAARTGCTVIRFDGRVVCGVDVRGSAPGTRETDLLAPTASVERIDAILLAGGSAFGLDAASGVVRYLEEHGLGYKVLDFRIPIVPGAILFDLLVGDGSVRPDAAMGYEAATRATHEPVAEGLVGAGCGAMVGKLAGIERAMPGGLGSASRRFGEFVVGALAVVNALGSIYDPETGERIAGARGDDGDFLDDVELFAEYAKRRAAAEEDLTNTTLGVVATNAALAKVEATKVAQLAHDGLARAIRPAHSMHDGDAIFACSTGTAAAPLDVVGALAAEVFAEAIVRAIRASSAA